MTATFRYVTLAIAASVSPLNARSMRRGSDLSASDPRSYFRSPAIRYDMSPRSSLLPSLSAPRRPVPRGAHIARRCRTDSASGSSRRIGVWQSRPTGRRRFAGYSPVLPVSESLNEARRALGVGGGEFRLPHIAPRTCELASRPSSAAAISICARLRAASTVILRSRRRASQSACVS